MLIPLKFSPRRVVLDRSNDFNFSEIESREVKLCNRVVKHRLLIYCRSKMRMYAPSCGELSSELVGPVAEKSNATP